MKALIIIENDPVIKPVKTFFDEENERFSQKMKFLAKQAEDIEKELEAAKKQFFSDIEERLVALNINYDKNTHYLRCKDGVIYSIEKQNNSLNGLPGFLQALVRGSFED